MIAASSRNDPRQVAVRGSLASVPVAAEIAVGFVTASVASLPSCGRSSGSIRRAGFCAVRVVSDRARLCVIFARWRRGEIDRDNSSLGQWLRAPIHRRVLPHVALSSALRRWSGSSALLTASLAPLATRLVGRAAPGVGFLILPLFGAGPSVLWRPNVIGRRVLARGEVLAGASAGVQQTIYTPVRQLVAAFSPDNDTDSSVVVDGRFAARPRDGVPYEGVHRRSRAGAGGH